MVAQHYRWDFIGLSTDTKPTSETSEKVVDGSTYYEADTSKLYVYCKDDWYEKTVEGGGGGGDEYYNIGDVINDMSITADEFRELGQAILNNKNIIARTTIDEGSGITVNCQYAITTFDYFTQDDSETPNMLTLRGFDSGNTSFELIIDWNNGNPTVNMV